MRASSAVRQLGSLVVQRTAVGRRAAATGPGGPWASANRPPVNFPLTSAFVFDKSGTRMSLSFPAVDASGRNGTLLAGIMNCRKKA